VTETIDSFAKDQGEKIERISKAQKKTDAKIMSMTNTLERIRNKLKVI